MRLDRAESSWLQMQSEGLSDDVLLYCAVDAQGGVNDLQDGNDAGCAMRAERHGDGWLWLVVVRPQGRWLSRRERCGGTLTVSMRVSAGKRDSCSASAQPPSPFVRRSCPKVEVLPTRSSFFSFFFFLLAQHRDTVSLYVSLFHRLLWSIVSVPTTAQCVRVWGCLISMTPPCPHTPLVSLVPDVLLLIFSHLSPSDLSRLSRTCRRLLTLVDRLGWRRYVLAHQQHTFLDRSKRSSSSSSGSTRAASSSRSAWFHRARFFHLVSQAWLQPWFIAHQRSIPTPPQITHKQLDFHRSAKLAFAIPRLVVGAHALVLALRSELYLYHPDLVREPTLLHLNSQAQASLCPAAAAAAAAPRPGPWQDVTAMTRLDHAGHMLFLGFADGVTQVVRISTRRHSKHAPSLRVVHAFASHSGPKHEIADLAAAIATADHARVRVLASITRRGRLRVAVLPLDLDAPPVRVDEWQIAPDGTHRPAHEAGAVRTRAWSLLVGGDGAQCWIAVGITGDPALFVRLPSLPVPRSR